MKTITHTTPDRAAWLRLRRQNLNSSEIASLWGWSPYKTPLCLWLEKSGAMDEEEISSERIDAGTFLEDGIAALARHRYGWSSRPFKDYVEAPAEKLGASFDYRIDAWGDAPAEGWGLNEIKNVDSLVFRGRDRAWSDDNPDDVLAPRHIEIQVQHQMMMSGAAYAVITPLVGGNELHHLVRLPNAAVHDKIQKKAAEFWASIQRWRDDGCPANVEAYAPPADISQDAELIMKMFARPNPYSTIPADKKKALEPLCDEFMQVRAERLAADKTEKELKAAIVAACGGEMEGKLDSGTKVQWAPSKSGVWTLRVSPAKSAS